MSFAKICNFDFLEGVTEVDIDDVIDMNHTLSLIF